MIKDYDNHKTTPDEEQEYTNFNFDYLIIDEDDMPTLESSRELFCEADKFNDYYGTHYTPENLDKFNDYQFHYNLEIEDAIVYIQTCHCCNEQLDIFAGEYCSGGCHYHVEELGLPCFRGTDCLICDNSGRKYDKNSRPPDSIKPIKNKCYRCLRDFAYPPFKYYSYDCLSIHEGMSPDLDIEACHDCFCKYSKRKTQFGQNSPITDLRSNHPVTSTISMFKEYKVYHLVDDLSVWVDLFQYM